jgi:hypothetical protein
MPPRVIPRSYALDAVLELLALPSNSTFYRSGLAGCIAHYPPGVYDAEAVEEWAQRLARRRALIALGVLSDKSPLVDAPTADDYDVPCPACDRLATVKPPQDEGEQTAFRAWSVGDAADYPAACGWCGWRSTT